MSNASFFFSSSFSLFLIIDNSSDQLVDIAFTNACEGVLISCTTSFMGIMARAREFSFIVNCVNIKKKRMIEAGQFLLSVECLSFSLFLIIDNSSDQLVVGVFTNACEGLLISCTTTFMGIMARARELSCCKKKRF